MNVKARIRWQSPSEGGRNLPPCGPKYSTVARFPEDEANWPDKVWSLVLEWQTTQTPEWEMVADVHFLVSEAPQELLHEGAVFKLYEGHKCVAVGEVIA